MERHLRGWEPSGVRVEDVIPREKLTVPSHDAVVCETSFARLCLSGGFTGGLSMNSYRFCLQFFTTIFSLKKHYTNWANQGFYRYSLMFF